MGQRGARAKASFEWAGAGLELWSYSSFSTPQTTDLDLGFQRYSLLLDFQTGRRPSVADRCGDYWRSECGRRCRTRSDGVSEVLACEAGLVTELFLDPVGKCERFIDVQLPSDGRPADSTAADGPFNESFEICACFCCFFNSPEQLVVLGQALGAARRTRLDLRKEVNHKHNTNQRLPLKYTYNIKYHLN